MVDAVRCAIEVQTAMSAQRGPAAQKRIEFRVGIHLGDVVEESDGDLMGDGVNIAARLESIAKPGAICLSEDAYRQVKGRLELKVSDLGSTQLKNIAEPIRVYSLEVGKRAEAQSARPAARALGEEELFASSARCGRCFPVRNRGGIRLAFSKSPSVHARRPGALSMVVLPFANLSGDPARITSLTGSRKT